MGNYAIKIMIYHELPLSYPQVPELTEAFVQECHKILAFQHGFASYARIKALKKSIADVQSGRAVWLQMGPCHENVNDSPKNTLALWKMADSLRAEVERLSSRRAVTVLRSLGQMVKPRTQSHEQRGEQALPIFRGQMLHEPEFHRAARSLCASRVQRAYDFSEAAWNRLEKEPSYRLNGFVSHEALLLHYEAALVRHHYEEPEKGGESHKAMPKHKLYGSSGHLLWIGARTNAPDGEHAKFLARLDNPIGIKIGPSVTKSHLLALLARLNPENEAGKIVLICRIGLTESAEKALLALVSAVVSNGLKVAWVIDPMHGNTLTNRRGTKIRVVETMLQECALFIKALKSLSVEVGGLHIEAGEGDFTECVSFGANDKGLEERYESLCDPRLNGEQTRYFVRTFMRMLSR